MSASVLIVEDEAPLRASMAIALKRASFDVTQVGTVADARAAIDGEPFDVVITDLRLPDGDGLMVLDFLRQAAPGTPAVMVTAFGSVQTAVEAMQLGAHDFVQKPFGPERLVHTVQRAIDHGRLAAKVERLEVRQDPASSLVGTSAPMRQVAELIRRSADARAVLILGETGTGKELVARSVHAAADASSPFVVVNCAALSETMLDSELFGHVKGSFTGAAGARKGLLEEADGGSLFLDEMGELPMNLQAKLLRFLQFGEVRRLGSNKTLKIRARIVAATNRDLQKEVREGRFREDLYYRLNVFEIRLPPLRERTEDLPELCRQLLGRVAGELGRPTPTIGDDALDAIRGQRWPGNVRELENALERAMLLAGGGPISAEHFPGGDGATAPSAAKLEPLEVVEKRHILGILDIVGGDKRRAADVLEISRSTLRRKLIEYGRWGDE